MTIRMCLTCVALVTGMMAPRAAMADPARLTLDTTTRSVVAGQAFQVSVNAESPEIYGAEMCVGFDPGLLEVVDADAAIGGTQVTPGSFLPEQQGFVLENRVDDKRGCASYAVTLLRPAQVVRGKGRLATVTFRARRSGVAEIRVTGLFGTTQGQPITPELQGRTVNIREAGVVGAAMAAADTATARWRDMIGGNDLAWTFFAAVVLGLVWAVLVRRRQPVRPLP